MTTKLHTDPRLHLLGIRHHGPGSARAVLAALDAADPATVLIEGPADADEILRFAASPDMMPPVAILVHAADDASISSFYPFAEFSPEWVAMRWALERQRPARFIDLPIAHARAARAAEKQQPEATAPPDDTAEASDAAPETAGPATPAPNTETADLICRDPLAYLALLAGYNDSEAWWNAIVEQGAHGPEIFAAIEQAMTALRDKVDADGIEPAGGKVRENQREAHMRLAITAALAETDGPIAVVCGAWHVPALRRKIAAKDDRTALSGLPKVKVTATWVPWTEPRLATASGYGAGVSSPGWYAHLWAEMQSGGTAATRIATGTHLAAQDFTSRWQARVAALLRKNGRPTSTASVIEASRLAITLASLRDLALPGLDEMREASLATLCEGEAVPFRLIDAELVIGKRVGEIDETVPQMPLAADLARWQKRLKLKPEALDTDISLDLRSETGLAKSLLLHRLRLLTIAWGTPTGAGSSRGTFRENWRLRWDPEFSVRLADQLVYGPTILIAAGNRAVADAKQATTLAAISELVRGCLDAGLDAAARETIAHLQSQAAQSDDIANLAGAVPPLADILRYGSAREIPQEPLRLLVTSLTETVCAGLVYAARNLQAETAADLRTKLAALDVAIGLLDDKVLAEAWQRALEKLALDNTAHPLLHGLAVRLRYDRGADTPERTALYFSRGLSPSVAPSDAGAWIDGFLGTSGQLLLHDVALLHLIDTWLVGVAEEDFINLLPVLRRCFGNFDRSERRRLFDEIMKSRTGIGPTATAPLPAKPDTSDAPGFAAALPLLLTILGAQKGAA